MAGGLANLAAWVRSRPLLRGAARMVVRSIPDRPVTINRPEIGRIRIRMRRHRWMLWERFAQGDTGMLGVFNRLIKPGDTVYDIGANIGLYTRIMLQWFDAVGVIAIEPMNENYELLVENIRLGGAQNCVRPFKCALGDSPGEEALQIDDMNSGQAVLDRVSGGQASTGRAAFGLPPRTEKVRVALLDDLVAQEGLPKPGFIKIDVEGAEAMVIRGGMITLRTHRPRLAIALHGPDKALATLELLAELKCHAYGARMLDGQPKWMRLAPGDADHLADNNIVASWDEADVREEIVPQVGGRVS